MLVTNPYIYPRINSRNELNIRSFKLIKISAQKACLSSWHYSQGRRGWVQAPMKKGFAPSSPTSKGGEAKNLYTKSERSTSVAEW